MRAPSAWDASLVGVCVLSGASREKALVKYRYFVMLLCSFLKWKESLSLSLFFLSFSQSGAAYFITAACREGSEMDMAGWMDDCWLIKLNGALSLSLSLSLCLSLSLYVSLSLSLSLSLRLLYLWG